MLVQDGPDPLPRPQELGRPEDFADLETAVARISRFLLRVQALADRMDAADVGQDAAGDRQRRLHRLRATVDVGQRTIQATVWQHADRRRRGERRASPRRQAADRRVAGQGGGGQWDAGQGGGRPVGCRPVGCRPVGCRPVGCRSGRAATAAARSGTGEQA